MWRGCDAPPQLTALQPAHAPKMPARLGRKRSGIQFFFRIAPGNRNVVFGMLISEPIEGANTTNEDDIPSHLDYRLSKWRGDAASAGRPESQTCRKDRMPGAMCQVFLRFSGVGGRAHLGPVASGECGPCTPCGPTCHSSWPGRSHALKSRATGGGYCAGN